MRSVSIVLKSFAVTGLTRCRSKPISRDRRRSSSCPQPVTATIRASEHSETLSQPHRHLVTIHPGHFEVQQDNLAEGMTWPAPRRTCRCRRPAPPDRRPRTSTFPGYLLPERYHRRSGCADGAMARRPRVGSPARVCSLSACALEITGNLTTNSLPMSGPWLWAVMVPPCNSTRFLARLNPIPPPS